MTPIKRASTFGLCPTRSMHIRAIMLFRFMARLKLVRNSSRDVLPRSSRNQLTGFGDGRIARGKLTVIGGDPEEGKSQLGVFISATISNGGTWPNNEGRAPRGSVIFLSAEDGAEDTLVPRLIAAGADRRKIHLIEAV